MEYNGTTTEPNLASQTLQDDVTTVNVEVLSMLRLYNSVGVVLNNYVNVAMAIFGAAANTIAAHVMRPRARTSSTFNYFFGMAITDVIYLTSVTLQWFLYTRFGVDLRMHTHCSVFFFLYSFSEMSACFLLICCTERAVVVYFPTRAKHWFSPLRARLAMAGAVVVVLACNWNLFGATRNAWEHRGDANRWAVCEGRTPFAQHYQKRVWPWVHSAVYSIIPSLGLIIANAAIVVKFAHSSKTSPGLVVVSHTTMSKNARRVNVTAVMLAILYLVTTIPSIVSILVIRLNPLHVTLERYAVMHVLISVTYLNHSCNMLLYLACSSHIRNDVRGLFKIDRLLELVTSSATTSTSATQPATKVTIF